ncbi:MAG: metallophosphoesterase [Chloroflexota bacterium]|nr:metallophosphoesterase [Chloroflexota bacterium]
MLDARLPHLPDEWTVWAFSDSHGVTSALAAALQEAGLIDATHRWVAPPRTALVGCGDYIDRGDDVRGTVELLQRLQTQAAEVEGAVVLARGNHEIMPLMVRRGEHEWLETWLEYGGNATLAAYGCEGGAANDPEAMLAALESCAPGLFDWFGSLAQAVRWRDVLFVHGGLAPGHAPDDLGVTTEEHLWVRSGFFDAPWDADAFDAYRAAGIGRVVFGHTPQWQGPTQFHGGHSLDIDTNAVGNPRMPDHAVQQLTLLGLGDSDTFDDARFITIPTRDAPDTMRR